MKKSELLYNISKNYFKTVVKRDIVIENWEGSDLDTQYSEYAKHIRDIINKVKNFKDEEVNDALNQLKNVVIKKYYDVMAKNFSTSLKENSDLTEIERLNIIRELNSFEGTDKFKEYLEKFRSEEEKVYG